VPIEFSLGQAGIGGKSFNFTVSPLLKFNVYVSIGDIFDGFDHVFEGMDTPGRYIINGVFFPVAELWQ
jgi:hypothetical protein